MESLGRDVHDVHIIGAGMAGSEAAHFLAQRGFKVLLREMRPARMTEAHQTEHCAELVCSNSFKSRVPTSAPGMLKHEMRALGSLLLPLAETHSVPGGEALAVDREAFAQAVTQKLRSHPNITFESGECTAPEPAQLTVLATGPLTSPALCEWIEKITDNTGLYFYDAIAPIIDAASIDWDHAFLANRYDKGEEVAYVNCPMDQAQYEEFIDALTRAEKVAPKRFEEERFFQGCQPIEAIAATGENSLRYGPMKPVGLTDPRTGKRPYAVVQLRPENRSLTAYNLVGFQTKLKYGEQSRVFRLIPGLGKAEFIRLGSIHRNTFVCGPRVLRPDLSLRKNPLVYLAGQITGVEGYLESAACGLLTGIFVEQRLRSLPHRAPPANTALGALLRHICASNPKHYQPANINFSILDPQWFDGVVGLERDPGRKLMAEQAARTFERWVAQAPGAVG